MCTYKLNSVFQSIYVESESQAKSNIDRGVVQLFSITDELIEMALAETAHIEAIN
jgi:hypothetical protein